VNLWETIRGTWDVSNLVKSVTQNSLAQQSKRVNTTLSSCLIVIVVCMLFNGRQTDWHIGRCHSLILATSTIRLF